MTLPREVFLWLSSLDLSQKFRTPRRTLSSGYTVGEILSKYFPDVPIHGLQPYAGRRERCINWSVVFKTFKKHGINASWDVIKSAMNEEPGAAEAIILVLYESLAKKCLWNPPLSKKGTLIINMQKPVKSRIETSFSAQVLLGLDQCIKKEKNLEELLTKITGMKEWVHILLESNKPIQSSFLGAMLSMQTSIVAAIQTEPRDATIVIYSRLLKNFFQETQTNAFSLSRKILRIILPLYASIHSDAKEDILGLLKELHPLESIPDLHQKLGYIARLFDITVKDNPRESLCFFRSKMCPETYVYFLANFTEFKNHKFWINHTHHLILESVQNTKLRTPVLCLITTLFKFNINVPVSAIFIEQCLRDETYTQQNMYLIVSFCLAFKAILPKRILDFALQNLLVFLNYSEVLGILNALFPMICSSDVSLVFAELMSRLDNFDFFYDCVSISPIPFMVPVKIVSLRDRLKESMVFSESLLNGVLDLCRKTKCIPKLTFLKPVIGYFMQTSPGQSCEILKGTYLHILGALDQEFFSILGTMCMNIPASYQNEIEFKKIVGGLFLALAHKKRHAPAEWVDHAIMQIASTENQKRTIWHLLCEELKVYINLYGEILGKKIDCSELDARLIIYRIFK